MIENRTALAIALREAADHASEIEIRQDLSRSYYSIYHAAKLLDRTIEHHNIGDRVGELLGDPELSRQIVRLKDIRSKADYTPDLGRDYQGLAELQLQSRQDLELGRRIFARILDAVREQDRAQQ